MEKRKGSPSPDKPHAFWKTRGPAPAHGDAKCRCGKRHSDPIHTDRRLPRIPSPPAPETVSQMLKRHERMRQAARRWQAEQRDKAVEATGPADTMFLDLDEELEDYGW